ncbi:MAG: hypothetical protein Kow00108_03350 [Calditrichia bacterium]
MSLPVIILIFIILFLLLVAGLLWLRKFQYDSIELNFSELGKQLGGGVARSNVFQRPYFRGDMNGKEVSIGITSERHKGNRDIYLYYTIACQSSMQLSIMNKEWLQKRENNSGHEGIAIAGGKYLLQTSQAIPSNLKTNIEKTIKQLPDFAYILVADTGIILELISTDLIEDTRVDTVMQVLQGMNTLSELLLK